MDYTVKFSFVMFGETPPLSKVAEAIARQKTSGGVPNRYHHGTYVQKLGKICRRLLVDARNGALKICDQDGMYAPISDIVKACPMARNNSRYPVIFTLYAKQKHLADWGALDGDTFTFQDTGHEDTLDSKGSRITLEAPEAEFLADLTGELNTVCAGTAPLIDWGELVGDIDDVQGSGHVDTLVNNDLPIALESPATKARTDLSNAVEPGSDDPSPQSNSDGLPTKDIINIFNDVNGWPSSRWTKNLSASKWLHPARTALGGAGVANSMWNPLTLAQLLLNKTKEKRPRAQLVRTLKSRFNNDAVLIPWRDAFNEYFDTFTEGD